MVTDMAEPLTDIQRANARIAELEAEIARLRPAAPVATLEGPFVTPHAAQVAKLIDLTLTRFPVLRPKGTDHERFVRSVRTAMVFLGSCYRLPNGKLDDQYRERWRDRAEQWVTQQGLSAVRVTCFGSIILDQGRRCPMWDT
jgi:hypothetical protein